MQNAIISNRRIDTSIYLDRPLTEDEIRRVAPSVYALEPHESRSERYAYIPTGDVIHGLEREGWVVYGAAQARCKTPEKKEHTRHMLRLRHRNALANTGREIGPNAHVISENVKEIIISNSHDGSSAYQCFGGVMRKVCTNGLMVPETVLQNISVRHSGKVVHEVIEGAFQLMDGFKAIDSSMEGMQALQLTDGQQDAFARAAVALRFDVEDVNRAPVRVDQVLRARRFEDRRDDLWTTFNRVQENLVQGGLHGRVANKRTTTRGIHGIQGQTALNKGLWTLAEALKAAIVQA